MFDTQCHKLTIFSPIYKATIARHIADRLELYSAENAYLGTSLDSIPSTFVSFSSTLAAYEVSIGKPLFTSHFIASGLLKQKS